MGDFCPHEGGICNLLFQCGPGACINPVALNVNADAVGAGHGRSHLHGVFALATGQFEDQRIVIFKKCPAPATSVVHLLPRGVGQKRMFEMHLLQHVGIGAESSKFLLFSLCHNAKIETVFSRQEIRRVFAL